MPDKDRSITSYVTLYGLLCGPPGRHKKPAVTGTRVLRRADVFCCSAVFFQLS